MSPGRLLFVGPRFLPPAQALDKKYVNKDTTSSYWERGVPRYNEQRAELGHYPIVRPLDVGINCPLCLELYAASYGIGFE